MMPSRLFMTNSWPVRAHPQPEVGARRGRLALRRILLANQLQQRLLLALVVEQDAPDGVLAALRQRVGVDVEDLAARVVAEDQLVGERADGGLR